MRFTRLALLATLALVILPLATDAEPRAPRRPKVGVVDFRDTPGETWFAFPVVKAFLEGMEALHWVRDRDFVVEIRPAYRFAHIQHAVASLIVDQVDVMLFLSCNTQFHIARRMTHPIPIVVGP